MQGESYRRKLLFLWQIRFTLIYLPLAALLSAVVSVLRFGGRPVFGFILAAVWAMAVFVALPAYLRQIELLILKEVLAVKRGLFFRTTRVIPLKRIVYMKIYKTPFLSLLGLVGAAVKTVGGTVFLPEINKKTAALLKAKLREAEG